MIKYLLFLLVFSIQAYCPFCDDKVINRQRFASDDLTYVLYNHRPALEGHSLLVPKRHVERFEELTNEEVSSIFDMVKLTYLRTFKVFGSKAYKLVQNNGSSVGQTVKHIHLHYMPTSVESGYWHGIWFNIRTVLFYPIRFQLSDSELDGIIKKLTLGS